MRSMSSRETLSAGGNRSSLGRASAGVSQTRKYSVPRRICADPDHRRTAQARSNGTTSSSTASTCSIAPVSAKNGSLCCISTAIWALPSCCGYAMGIDAKWIPVNRERMLTSAADSSRGVAGSVSNGSKKTLEFAASGSRWAMESAASGSPKALDSTAAVAREAWRSVSVSAAGLLSVTQGVLASTISADLDAMLAGLAKGPATIYDKAMDAGYLATNIGPALWPAGERREGRLIMHDKGYYHSLKEPPRDPTRPTIPKPSFPAPKHPPQ